MSAPSQPEPSKPRATAAPALPDTSPSERQHSEMLTRHIRAEIESHGGQVDFSRFMDLALYAPGLGYYSSARSQFAAAELETGAKTRERSPELPDDYTTAPEIGPVFAYCLARQCRQILDQLGGGSILETGAGSGLLAADLLQELERIGALPERYLILELSGELRIRQLATITHRVPKLVGRVHWLDALPTTGFNGIVVGNELLDAMPVERFLRHAQVTQQFGVGWHDGRFIWKTRPADVRVQQRVRVLDLPQDYVSEINFRAEAWVRSVADVLDSGAVLLIDYGFPRAEYYHPQRREGTLMCHYRHRAHGDPLIRVGLQDITAHVDFTGIAHAGADTGLSLLGYTSQAAFLIANGIDELISAADPNDARGYLNLVQQIKKLTLPQEMGELYKVIALGREIRGPLAGFATNDRAHQL